MKNKGKKNSDKWHPEMKRWEISIDVKFLG